MFENKTSSFKEVADAMKKISKKEIDAELKKFDTLCFCPRCPTHMGTGEKTHTFCVRGKSRIIRNEKGCLCPACPVQANLHLTWVYYCTRGSGMEQSGMK